MNVLSVARFDADSDRANLNCNRNPTNTNSSLGIAYVTKALKFNSIKFSEPIMKTYKNLYSKIYDIDNLMKAWRKARKGKTKKEYVLEFEKDTMGNLFKLQKELIEQTYQPKPLKIFIVRDPKTRKIAKSAFRDRVIHHALIRVIEPIFDKIFIYDSCANRKGKGNLFALKRFDEFKRKVSSNGKIVYNKFNNNNYVKGYCFKADIKHYFQEVDHNILISLIEKKIQDEKVLCLINKILKNRAIGGGGRTIFC